MKVTDPLEEIRFARETHAKRFDYNLHLIADDIKKGEKKLLSEGWKLIHRKSSMVETNRRS